MVPWLVGDHLIYVYILQIENFNMWGACASGLRYYSRRIKAESLLVKEASLMVYASRWRHGACFMWLGVWPIRQLKQCNHNYIDKASIRLPNMKCTWAVSICFVNRDIWRILLKWRYFIFRPHSVNCKSAKIAEWLPLWRNSPYMYCIWV